MKPIFVSKSSKKAKAVAKKSLGTEAIFSKGNPIQVGAVVRNDFIAWIGRGFPKRDSFGFKNLDIAKSDLSILVNAKLLVIIHSIYLQRVNAAVNFAFEHGIPILWVNNISPPKDKTWFFDAISNDIRWELICQMTK